MKNKIISFFQNKKFLSLAISNIFLFSAAIGLNSFITVSDPSNLKLDLMSNKPQLRKIVVFDKKFTNYIEQDKLITKSGGIKIKNLDLINAKVIQLPNKAAEKVLYSQAGIKRIDDDIIIKASKKPENQKKEIDKTQQKQVLPWGVNRIDADIAWKNTKGDSIKVAIIDTGIDLSHPDLKANINGAYNAINHKKSANDNNGHGSHVAGIIAAADNKIGIIGVAPKAELYAIKALNHRGNGHLSDIIEGLEWAINNSVQVINMSLGTETDVISFQEAIKKARDAGIIQVASAGNNSGTVKYPAAYPEVIAVSATDQVDILAPWSSRGKEIDLAAPGVNILSTYKKGTYETTQGTSAAAAHVTGTVALLLTTPVGSYDSNADGEWNPAEVEHKLKTTAEDLGIVGLEYIHGAGLIDAEKATQ